MNKNKVLLMVTMGLTIPFMIFFLFYSCIPKATQAELILNYERQRAGLVPKGLDIQGVHMAYLEGGRGEPLLLIHGSGDDKDHWLKLARHLTGRFRVIAPDLPGFGESDRLLERSYRAKDQVENLRAFTRALGVKTFHLGGHSLGGKISGLYAARYPSQVKTLWLMAPAGVYSARPSQMQRLLRRGYHIPIYGKNIREFDLLLHFTMNKPPFIPRSVKEVLIERALADYSLHNRIYQEVAEEAQSLEEVALKLTMPTLVVWGDQDRILDPSGAEVLERILPRPSVVLLEGVGHAPMLEEPKKTAEACLEFVDTVHP